MKKLLLIFLPFFVFSQDQDNVIKYIEDFKKNPQIFYSELSREYIYDGHKLILPEISTEQSDFLYKYIINSEVSDWHISWRGVNLYFNSRCILGDCMWGKGVHFDVDQIIITEFKDSVNQKLDVIYKKRGDKFSGIINEMFIVEGSSSPKYFQDSSYKYLIDYNFQEDKYKIGIWKLEDDFVDDPYRIFYNGKSKSDGQLGDYTISFLYKHDFFLQNQVTFLSFFDGSNGGGRIDYTLSIWSEIIEKDEDIEFKEFPSPSLNPRISSLIRIFDYFIK